MNTLTVYAHGRADGEQCSTAIIEAMSHGLPIISHSAPSMGHAEQIGNAGAVVDNVDYYAIMMRRMIEEESFASTCGEVSLMRYQSKYSITSIIDQYVELFEEAVK